MRNNKKIVIGSTLVLLVILSTNVLKAQTIQPGILSPFNQQQNSSEKPVSSLQPPSGHVEKQTITDKGSKNATKAKAKEPKEPINSLLNPSNQLGLKAPEIAINKAAALAKTNHLDEAGTLISQEVQWLADATEYHTNLFKVLKGVDNAETQADFEREMALQFAILRDKALYESALICIQQKKSKAAVEKLVDIVRSQPKTKLGFDAYETLQKIGFTYKVRLQIQNQNPDDSTQKPPQETK